MSLATDTFSSSKHFLQVVAVPKYAAEDSTLMTRNAAGEKVAVPVPRGSSLSLHVCGLHYNRMYTRSSLALANLC